MKGIWNLGKTDFFKINYRVLTAIEGEETVLPIPLEFSCLFVFLTKAGIQRESENSKGIGIIFLVCSSITDR